MCMTLALFGWFPTASAQTCPTATSADGCKSGAIMQSDGSKSEFKGCSPAMPEMMYKMYYMFVAMYDKKKLCATFTAGGSSPAPAMPDMEAPAGPEVQAAIDKQKVCALKTTAAECTGECECNGDGKCTLKQSMLATIWNIKASESFFPVAMECMNIAEDACKAKSACEMKAGKCNPNPVTFAKDCVASAGSTTKKTASAGSETSGSTSIPGVALGFLAAVMTVLLLQEQ